MTRPGPAFPDFFAAEAEDERLKRATAARSSARRDRFALSPLHPRRMGEAARRHRTDADDRRSAQAAVDPRSDFARRSRGDLSAAVAPAGALCRGDAGPVQGDAALPRRRRRQGALHHRRRRLGGGRQVDHRARAAGAADALAQHAQGPAVDDRRLPPSQRQARARRADGAQGLPRELRRRGADPRPRRGQGGRAQRHRAGLFAPHLRRRARRDDRRRPARHPHRRGAQRAAAQPPVARGPRDSVRLRFLRLLGVPRRQRGAAGEMVRRALHAPAPDRVPRSAQLFPQVRRHRRRRGGGDRALAVAGHQPRQPAREHPADAPARQPQAGQGREPPHREVALRKL